MIPRDALRNLLPDIELELSNEAVCTPVCTTVSDDDVLAAIVANWLSLTAAEREQIGKLIPAK